MVTPFSKIFLKNMVGLWLFSSVLYLASCERNSPYLQGYVEGRYTYVASNVSGRLQNMLVKRGDAVQPGQLLFILESEPQMSQLNQAKAQVEQSAEQIKSAQAGLNLAEITFKRYNALKPKSYIDLQAVDQAKTQKDQALASLNQATSHLEGSEAALKQSEWYYQEKKIHAIKEGIVFDTYYQSGELAPANHPLLSLLNTHDIYVIFYISGARLSEMKLNQPVQIRRVGLSQPVKGKITYISPSAEYAPPVIYSNETNDKLVFRIEVTPDTPSYHLHPGEPVEIQL